ncbi:MAG: type IX secretion system membrane protein PorP/SprF [Bacteroidia bacterium]|nr:type IX secretion system membrane protein PorP/SprF [Bacteroidia bacterium]MDW8014786.1 type IX secretion system membrane protein PorP/SprF [Bacteroidia bacterium]
MRYWWLLATLVGTGWAQQDPQFTQYMYNRFGLNPAAAGYAGAWQFVALGRLQWIGIDGHPRSFVANAHTPVTFLRGGVGLHLLWDEIGPFRTTDIKGAYAFRLTFGGGSILQLGVAGGIMNKSLDGAALRPEQIPDPTLFNRASTLTVPDVGAGVYFSLPEDRFYLGFSALHLTEPSLKDFTSTGRSRVPRHFYGTAGYTARLSETIELVPSAFFKLAQSQFTVDANLSLRVQPVLIGASYRLGDAVCALLGLQATEALFIGYSYDYPLSRLGLVTTGSHEFVIVYTLAPAFRLIPPDLGVRDKKDFR